MDPSEPEQSILPHPLRFSGEFWGERFFGAAEAPDSQSELISALAAVALNSPSPAMLPSWLLGKRTPSGMDVWAIPPTKEHVRFSSQWLEALPAYLEGDTDIPFIWSAGDDGIKLLGTSLENLESGIRINGFRLQDLAYNGAAAAFGFNAGEYVVLPKEGVALSDYPFDIEIGGERFTLPPRGSTSESGMPRLFELVRHDVWFIPGKGDPAFLLSSKGILTRGTGFRTVGKWILLFDDPEDLWPDRHIVALGQNSLPLTPLSSAAGVDMAQQGCEHVMTYLRVNQSAVQFERALAEIAGERVLEQDDVVIKASRHQDGYYYWLQEQGEIWLPGPPCYAVGMTVPAGRAHRLRVRSFTRDGRFWDHPRWKRTTLDSRVLWPHLPQFPLRNQQLTLIEQDGGLQVLDSNEEAVRQWRYLLTGLELSDLVENPTSEPSTINMVEWIFWQLRDRLLVIETDLPLWAPARWHLVRNWAERERPLGSVLVPGWTTVD